MSPSESILHNSTEEFCRLRAQAEARQWAASLDRTTAILAIAVYRPARHIALDRGSVGWRWR